jgi:hypothetical protein
MTEARARRRPSSRLVIWGSVALFAALLALLAFQLGSGGTGGAQTASRPVEVRKVIVRRVVTTVAPAAGESAAAPAETVSSAPVSTLTSAPAPEPAEPVTTGAS